MTSSFDPNVKAWHCEDCGRMEDADDNTCPACLDKRQRVSRFEWFLADALREFLARSGRRFTITEQWALRDHRGFCWYFDLLVTVEGKSAFGGIKQLIEIDGRDHKQQKQYGGRGGGYTRDYDKEWELFSVQNYHKSGYDLMRIENDRCRKAVVRQTAEEIGREIIRRADTWT